MRIVAVATDRAPTPAGSYSQAIKAGGLIFLSGQTPRDRSGNRLTSEPFDKQVSVALGNLEQVANAAGSSLRHAIKVNVFLRDPRNAAEFDRIFATFVGDPPPARTLTQSSFLDFEVEVDAIVLDLLIDPP